MYVNMPSPKPARAPSSRSKSMSTGPVALLGLALVVVMPRASAFAQSAAIDINRFHPAPGSGRIMATEMAEVGPDLQIVPQLFFHYAMDPLVFTIGGEEQARTVDTRLTAELSLALALRERYQIGLALPVTMFQDGEPTPMLPGFEDVSPPSDISSAGLEDLRFSAKGVFWQDQGYAVGASGHVTLQTGNEGSFMGSRLPTFDLKLVGHKRHGKLAASVNLGWLFASTEQVFLTRTGMGLSFGGGVQYDVYEYEGGVLALGAELFGLAHSRFDSLRETPIELLGSAKAGYQDWTFFLGAGPGVTRGYGEPDVRVLAGMSWEWDPSKLPPPPPPEPVIVKAPPPPPPPEPEPEPEPEKWVDNTLVLLSGVLFDYDRCSLNPASHATLREVAGSIRQHPEWGNIRIEGHASQEGDAPYNLRLSRCRAMSVRQFLITNGVPAERLEALGFGESCPTYVTGTPEELEKNRRVEFIRDPANNPPRCPVPDQLEPLDKHRKELEAP
jgi:outer membrane protein OmpA-like peptidoglycan-associated protein